MRRQPDSFAAAVRAFKELTAAADEAAATRARVLAAAEHTSRAHATPRRIALPTVGGAAGDLHGLAGRDDAGAALAAAGRSGARRIGAANPGAVHRAAPRRCRHPARPRRRRRDTRRAPGRRTPSPPRTGAPTARTSMERRPARARRLGRLPAALPAGGVRARGAVQPRALPRASGRVRPTPSARSGRSPRAPRRIPPRGGRPAAGLVARTAPRHKGAPRSSTALPGTTGRWYAGGHGRIVQRGDGRLSFCGGRTSCSASSGWGTSTSSTW